MSSESLGAAPAAVLDNRGLEPPQPMMRILERLETLGEGESLLAINEREPLFLYPELAARGWSYRTTPHTDGSFRIAISREIGAMSADPHDEAAPPPQAGPAVVVVDVRADQRKGKEPFTRIMAAVQALGADEELMVVNTFEPVPLYKVLGRQGFEHATTQIGPDEWRVRFWRAAARPGR